MNTISIARLLAAVALISGIGACGTDTKTNHRPTTVGGLSRNELATKANAICAAATARTPPLRAPANASKAKMAAEIGKVLPIYKQLTTALQALTPAADVASDWRAFITAQVAFYDMFRRFKQQLDANHAIGPADRGTFDPVIRRLADTSGRIGFTCARA